LLSISQRSVWFSFWVTCCALNPPVTAMWARGTAFPHEKQNGNSANIRGVSPEGASNDIGVIENGNFRFRWLFFGYFRDDASVIMWWYAVQSVVGFSMIPKCMNLNDLDWVDCLFRVKFCFRASLAGWDRATSENNCVKLINIDTYCQRRKSSTGTLVSGNIRLMRILVFGRVL